MVGRLRETPYGPFAVDFEEDRLLNLCHEVGIQTGPFGSQLHQEDYVPVGTPIITVEHLGENRIIHQGLPRVSDADRERLSRYLLRKGDIVFSRVGSVDRRALVGAEEAGWMFSGRCLRVRPNPAKIDSQYLSYFFGLPTFKEHIRAIAVGATMPSLNTELLSSVLIPHPRTLAEQRGIAHILGTLDDKIELNRRMSETMEAMARALFKSWFVDFDPVRAKAGGQDPGLPKHLADLFPTRLVDSELGEIPEGWEIKVLDDLSSIVLGGDWGVDEPSLDYTERVRCIRGADIPDLQAGGKGKMPLRHLKLSSIEKRTLADGDLVVEISGGSPTQSTGRPVFVSSQLLQRIDVPLVCSNFCRFMRPIRSVYSKFLYLWLRELYSADEFLRFENGTTGIKNLAFTLFSSSYKLCMPPDRVLTKFEAQVAPALERQQLTAAEAEILAALRDALLPKLISGELRVKDSEKFIGRTP